jgi:hypothetical protein
MHVDRLGSERQNGCPGAGESSQTFYAHVSDRHAAEDAVRHHLRSAADLKIEARLPIQPSAFDTMNIRDSQVLSGRYADYEMRPLRGCRLGMRGPP